MIELKNVSTGYGNKEIIHNVSAKIKKGKITTIVGKNGSGKSTLLKGIANILKLTEGEILINGENIKTKKDLAKVVAYLPQLRNLNDMTVSNLVLHGRFPYLNYPRKYKKEDIAIAKNAMKEMDIYDLKDKKISELSGGMRQKVYIAMALCQKTPVILFDEPSASLDIAVTLKLCEILKEQISSGKTVVLVLHDISLALKISDYILVMADGFLEDFGTPSEIMERNSLKKAFGVNIREVKIDGKSEYFYETKKERK